MSSMVILPGRMQRMFQNRKSQLRAPAAAIVDGFTTEKTTLLFSCSGLLDFQGVSQKL